jgi:hypothetical protein
MSEAYRTSVLTELGLSDADAKRIPSTCALRVPEHLRGEISMYIQILGPAIAPDIAGCSEALSAADGRSHRFQLMLWPHLDWVVNERPDGTCFDVGFRNQIMWKSRAIDPSVVRIGVWTRSELERLSDAHELYDGWDQLTVSRFSFAGQQYEGSFGYRLLQEWRKL